ncbi:sugar-phosphatase AraL-like isoform X3 [Littorina saxatilis]|uniref:sugar-phosphatase AraL-like isoform X3 n=1 Tax=Littorina saxatilis TaxID=31220 RepID=UPI0038B5F6FB
MQEMMAEDTDSYTNFVRMDPASFHRLLELVEPLLRKQETIMRQSISAAERLAVTLRFLASGDSYQSLRFLFRIGRTTLGEIIPEVCRALVTALKDEYLKVPKTTQEWEEVASAFKDRLMLDGAPLIAIHKARYYKRKDGLALGPGPFVTALEYSTDRKAEVVGKPEAAFFLEAVKDFGCDAAQCVMIGDDARDDVGGAQKCGMKGVLVKTGKRDMENTAQEMKTPSAPLQPMLQMISLLPWISFYLH